MPYITDYGLWQYTPVTDIEKVKDFILGGEVPIPRILNIGVRKAIEILTGAKMPTEMRWFEIEMSPGDRILVLKKRKGVSLAFMDEWEPQELLSKFEYGILWYISEPIDQMESFNVIEI